MSILNLKSNQYFYVYNKNSVIILEYWKQQKITDLSILTIDVLPLSWPSVAVVAAAPGVVVDTMDRWWFSSNSILKCFPKLWSTFTRVELALSTLPVCWDLKSYDVSNTSSIKVLNWWYISTLIRIWPIGIFYGSININLDVKGPPAKKVKNHCESRT